MTNSNSVKILSAASEIFLDGGAAALSVRAIAKRAGVSTIGIYSHFQGKQGILDTLYQQGFDLVYDAMTVVGEKATKSDVLDAVDNYLKLAQHNEAHYRLIFGEVDPGYQPSNLAQTARDRAFDRLVEVAASFLQTSDRARAIGLALDIWALIHGYVSIFHHAFRHNEVSIDWSQKARDAVSVLLENALVQ